MKDLINILTNSLLKDKDITSLALTNEIKVNQPPRHWNLTKRIPNFNPVSIQVGDKITIKPKQKTPSLDIKTFSFIVNSIERADENGFLDPNEEFYYFNFKKENSSETYSYSSQQLMWFNQNNLDEIRINQPGKVTLDQLKSLESKIEATDDPKERASSAIQCAEKVLFMFEKEYPNDKRPRQAIEAAKKYLEDPTEENRKIADNASQMARAASLVPSAAALYASYAADAAACAATSNFSYFAAYDAIKAFKLYNNLNEIKVNQPNEYDANIYLYENSYLTRDPEPIKGSLSFIEKKVIDLLLSYDRYRKSDDYWAIVKDNKAQQELFRVKKINDKYVKYNLNEIKVNQPNNSNKTWQECFDEAKRNARFQYDNYGEGFDDEEIYYNATRCFKEKTGLDINTLELDEIKVNQPVGQKLKAFQNPSGAFYLILNNIPSKNDTTKKHSIKIGRFDKKINQITFYLAEHTIDDFKKYLKDKGVLYNIISDDGLDIGIDIKYFKIKPINKWTIYDDDIENFDKILGEIKVNQPNSKEYKFNPEFQEWIDSDWDDIRYEFDEGTADAIWLFNMISPDNKILEKNDINVFLNKHKDMWEGDADSLIKFLLNYRVIIPSNSQITENKINKPTNLKDAIKSLTEYMIDQGMNIEPLPKLIMIDNDSENANDILGKTAYYNPSDCSITLYTLNRHPKDVMRSYTHEMIHRIQDNENRLNNINTTNTNEGGELLDLEREAYEKGNITFRNWEDLIKNQ